MKKRHDREEMARLFQERADQGLTYKQLSERSGIAIPTLGYWGSKFRRERDEAEATGERSFVKVSVVTAAHPDAVTVEIGESVRLRVAPGFDELHLVRLIAALRPLC